jgi:predicted Rdx family selenoprotein
MLQLRRIADQVVNRGASAAEEAGKSLSEARERGREVARSAYDRSNEAARMAYDYAMHHRRATTAVLLGTGIAAALIWMVQRNGGYAAMRKKVLQRVRDTSSGTRSRRRVAQASRSG